jgi:hypothetical protein
MPATLIPIVTPTLAGTTWPATDGTAADTTNENYIENSGKVSLLVANTGGGAATVTLRTPGTAGGLTIEDPVKNLAAGERKVYGTFPIEVYGNQLQFLGSAATVKFIPFQSI